MKANPDKFQAIKFVLEKELLMLLHHFNWVTLRLQCEDKVSLLGVTLDVQ